MRNSAHTSRWISVATCSAVMCFGFAHNSSYAAATHTELSQPKSSVESVKISDAWGPPALKGGTGGAYMTITNTGTTAVRVLSATSLNAQAVELHESTEHNGMAHMQMVPTLEIAAGASATLKPGARHFMLIGLKRAMVVRDTVRLVLLVQNVNTSAKSKVAAPQARVITALVEVRLP